MRSLPVQSGTIRIASIAGELRDVSVTGLTKAHLLWLFRNFYILDFPVLNKRQQQLIAQVWHAGSSAGSVDDSQDLIGTVEGFSPLLYQPSVSTARTKRHGVRFGLSPGMRIPAMWTAMGVLLLGFAMGSGPKHRLMPQTHVAAVVAATKPVSSTVAIPAKTSVESAPSAASVPAAAAETSSLPHFHLPDAMACDASSPEAMTPYSRVAVGTRALGKPEVMIRVSVDREGRAHAFKIVRGDRKKISAALDAARRWSFQPCAGSADCEHVLKFTDYGDASSVQIIE